MKNTSCCLKYQIQPVVLLSSLNSSTGRCLWNIISVAFQSRVGQAAKKVSRIKHFTTLTNNKQKKRLGHGPPVPPASHSPDQEESLDVSWDFAL